MPVTMRSTGSRESLMFRSKLSADVKRNVLGPLAQRLGGAPLRTEHIDAIINSPSLGDPHACAAIRTACNLVDITRRADKGPLSDLASLSVYDVMASGLMVRDKGISIRGKRFGGAMMAALEQIEKIKGSGVISADLGDFILEANATSMEFVSPTMVGLCDIAKIARANVFAVPACNVNNMEMAEAMVAAAAFCRAPIILEWSPGAFKYHGGAAGASLITRMEANKALAMGLPVPVCCHLDHGTKAAVIEAIKAKFSSVMFDPTEAGKIKNISFEDNVRLTAELAKMAHDAEISIEGEVGGPAGSFEDVSTLPPGERKKWLSDPKMVVDYCLRTGVDIVAVSVGTSHGAQKFKGKPFIDLDLLREIRAALDAAGLQHVGIVFHGGSDNSPFEEDISRLIGRPYDKKPSGTPISLQQAAIKEGVVKINLDTIFRHAQDYAALLMREPMYSFILAKGKGDFREFVGVPWRIALMNETSRKLFELGVAGRAGLFFSEERMSGFYGKESKSGGDVE
ncbi:MAG: class II fructose-bisphosphate aldolase [Candidatus Margulisiibacteriota bacterium]